MDFYKIKIILKKFYHKKIHNKIYKKNLNKLKKMQNNKKMKENTIKMNIVI